MKCYIFNGDVSRESSAVMVRKMLSEAQMKKVFEKSKKLAQKLADDGAKNVRIYGSNESESSHIVSILTPVLESKGLMSEEDVFLSDDFKGRNYGKVYDHSKEKVGVSKIFKSAEARSLLKSNLNLENAHGIEKKCDFEQRVFEDIFRIIAENPSDSTIVLVVGEEFIKACQKNEDIHSMIYFGDEHIIDPSLFRMRHHFTPYNVDMVSVCNDAMVNESTLKSRMDIPYLGYSEAIFEAPEVSETLGYIQPVYQKYAKIKLAKELEEKKKEEGAILQK